MNDMAKKKLKRIMILFWSVMLSVIPFHMASAVCYTSGNGIKGNGTDGIYINIYGSPYTDFAKEAKNGSLVNYCYGRQGCAWFASARLCELTGLDSAHIIWSGKGWYSDGNYRKFSGLSAGKSFNVDHKALICFEGHIAVIEDYFPTTGEIVISEGGAWEASNNHYCKIGKYASISAFCKYNGISTSSLLGYIYMPVALPHGGVSTVDECTVYGCSAANGNGIYRCTARDGLTINTGHNYSSPSGVDIPYGATVTVTKMASSGTYAHVTYNGVSGIASKNFLQYVSASSGDCSTYGCSDSFAGYYRVVGTDGTLVVHSTHDYDDNSAIGEIPENGIVWVSKGATASSKTFFHVSYNGLNGIVSRNFLRKLNTYTISFQANGGIAPLTDVQVWQGTSDFYDISNNIPFRENYTFEGWYTDANDGVCVYDASGYCTNEGTYWSGNIWNYGGNVTLYAHWKQTTYHMTSLKMTKEELTLMAGDSEELKCTYEPANTTNPFVEWESSDSTVAAVDDYGKIYAVKAGNADITVRSTDGTNLSAVCRVTVTPNIDSMELARYYLEMSVSGIGSEYLLKPVVVPDDAVYEIHYTSSNTEAVTVSDTGLLSAKAPGTAQVTISIVNGPEVEITVLVKNMEVFNIPTDVTEIQEEAFADGVMERITLPDGLEIIDSRAFADNKDLRYILIPNSVRFIEKDAFDNDRNVCILCGENSYAEKWAIENGFEYQFDKQAEIVRVKQISVPGDMSITVENEIEISAAVYPANATNKTLSWSSSQPEVAQVTEEGTILGRQEGTALITVAATDGSGVSRTFQIDVVLPEMKIEFSHDESTQMVTDDNAVLTASASVAGIENSKISKAGIALYHADGSILKVIDTNPVFENGKLIYHVDINTDLKEILEPSTEYQYSFYMIIYGKKIESERYAFKTKTGEPRISLSVSELTLKPGESYTLTPVIKYTDSTMLSWMSSKSTVARVRNGEVTAVAAGKAQITVMLSLEDGTRLQAVCSVTVADTTDPQPEPEITIQTISVANAPSAMEIGDSCQLSVNVFPENASNKNVAFSSSNANIVSVSETGYLTALSSGNAQITVTATDGSGTSASFQVTVTSQVIFSGERTESISTTTAYIYADVSSALPLTAYGVDVYSAEGTLFKSWSADNPYPSTTKKVWFDTLESETGISLNANTVYSWQIFVMANGRKYCSARVAFRTAQAAENKNVIFSNESTGVIYEDTASVSTSVSSSIPLLKYGINIYNEAGLYKTWSDINQYPNTTTRIWFSTIKSETGISLLPNTNYWWEIFVDTSVGMVYSNRVAFTTTSVTEPNLSKIQKVLNKANAWVDYTWTAPSDVPVYNNDYGNASSSHYQEKCWFKTGTVMHGIPYTYGGKKTMDSYAVLSPVMKSEEALQSFQLSSGLWTPWQSKYGADCSCLVATCLYEGDQSYSALQYGGSVNTKSGYFDAKEYLNASAGDILVKSGHIMLITSVNGDTIDVIEQCGNGTNRGALNCKNKTLRPAGGYYVCGTCSYCAGDNKGATRRSSYSITFLRDKEGYKVYRYRGLYQ